MKISSRVVVIPQENIDTDQIIPARFLKITDKADKKPDADKKSPDHTGSIGGQDEADAAEADAASRDTLTPGDLAVEWRGLP